MAWRDILLTLMLLALCPRPAAAERLLFTGRGTFRDVAEAPNPAENLIGLAGVEYDYASRLPGEPAGGVDDIHLYPVAPRTVRLGVQFDF